MSDFPDFNEALCRVFAGAGTIDLKTLKMSRTIKIREHLPPATETPMPIDKPFLPIPSDQMTRDQLAMSATDADLEPYLTPWLASRETARYKFADAMIKARGEGAKDAVKVDMDIEKNKQRQAQGDAKCSQATKTKGYIVTHSVSGELLVRSPRVLTYVEAKNDAEVLIRQGFMAVSIQQVGELWTTWNP